MVAPEHSPVYQERGLPGGIEFYYNFKLHKVFIYSLSERLKHKNINRFTYQDLYIIGRKEMKRESNFDVSSIPSISSVGKAVAGKVKKTAILKKFHVKLKIKGKDTMLIDSGFTSKKGYEKLINSGKVIPLSEAARLYFN